jgi:hypothetical protein
MSCEVHITVTVGVLGRRVNSESFQWQGGGGLGKVKGVLCWIEAASEPGLS